MKNYTGFRNVQYYIPAMTPNSIPQIRFLSCYVRDPGIFILVSILVVSELGPNELLYRHPMYHLYEVFHLTKFICCFNMLLAKFDLISIIFRPCTNFLDLYSHFQPHVSHKMPTFSRDPQFNTISFPVNIDKFRPSNATILT